jgi:hypothetical protein
MSTEREETIPKRCPSGGKGAGVGDTPTESDSLDVEGEEGEVTPPSLSAPQGRDQTRHTNARHHLRIKRDASAFIDECL